MGCKSNEYIFSIYVTNTLYNFLFPLKVVTRKGGVLADSVGLLIIDEVHLLAEERGSVIESLVARLHRHVETKQELCRIVGLSATLPSYEDVAKFLKARCFFFGPEYRPVPLEQTFVGVTETSRVMQDKRMKMVCLKYLFDSLKRGHQVKFLPHCFLQIKF